MRLQKTGSCKQQNLFFVFLIDFESQLSEIMSECNDSQNESESDDQLDPFLCFPELMTKHQLMRVFKMRYLSPPKEQSIDGYEYCNLIALYNKVLLPLPQRKYGNSRKSKELAAKQMDCNKGSAIKRKFENNNTNENFTKMLITATDSYSSPETVVNPNAQQIHDHKRQRISWP